MDYNPRFIVGATQHKKYNYKNMISLQKIIHLTFTYFERQVYISLFKALASGCCVNADSRLLVPFIIEQTLFIACIKLNVSS